MKKTLRNLLAIPCAVSRRRDLNRSTNDVIEVTCRRNPKIGRESDRSTQVAFQFGLPQFEPVLTILDRTKIPLAEGQIVLLLGPSGSGKSSVIEQIEQQFPNGHAVQRVQFSESAAIVDQIAPGREFGEVVRLLTACGLAEPRLWLRTFDSLSEGERFRAKLARAIGLHEAANQSAPLLCDEFCSSLHRRAAKAIAHNLRKLTTQRRLRLVLATNNEDVVRDLQPDVIVRLCGGGNCEVTSRRVLAGRPVSFRRGLSIVPGCKKDYESLSAMHYRATDELGFVDKVFVLRERASGEALGVVVYSHGPLELSLRNKATNGWFVKNPERVNRHLRILRRLVVHPDVRGCGLGHFLVRKTMPLVGTTFVECLATMGRFSPVFERAGMTRIGHYDLSKAAKSAIAELRKLDVNPASREFEQDVHRRTDVRHIVTRVVHDWYAATTAGGESRVEHQSPKFLATIFRNLISSRPVYYLWKNANASNRATRSVCVTSPLETTEPVSANDTRRVGPALLARREEPLLAPEPVCLTVVRTGEIAVNRRTQRDHDPQRPAPPIPGESGGE